MNIKTKIILAISLMFTIIVCIVIYSHYQENNRINAYLNKKQQENFKIVKYLFTQTTSPIESFTRDYTYWDDMVKFTKTKNTSWADEYIVEGSSTFNANFVAIYDTTKKPFYIYNKDESTLDTESYIDTSKINFEEPEFYSFFINNDNKLIAIFGAPIHPISDSARKSKPLGYMFTGFYWDSKRIKEIEEITNTKINIRLENFLLDNENSLFLKGIGGKNLANLSIQRLSIIDEIINYSHTQNIILLAVTIIFFIFVIILVYLLLTKPLTTISLALKNDDIKELEKLGTMTDEFGDIASTITEYLKNNKILSQYRLALDQSSIISKTNPLGLITYANEKFCNVSGYSLSELIGKPHSIIRHPSMPKNTFKTMWNTIKNGKPWNGVLKNKKKSGEEYYVKTVIIPILDDHNEIIEYIAIRNDVTDLILQEKVLTEQTTDMMTLLPNRYKLITDINKNNSFKRLALINIERFREINDSYGHEIGDLMLKEFALTVARIIPNQIIFYRISGDEFAILDIYNIYSEDEFVLICRDILKYFQKNEITVADCSVILSPRIGVSSGTKNLYINAELAITDAKESRKTLVVFNEKSNYFEIIKHNMEWSNTIKKGIEDDMFQVVFQKISPLKNTNNLKYEVLLRYKNKEGLLITPDKFLDIAKKAKLYNKLTCVVIQKSFTYFANKDVEFSINLSISDVMHEETRAFLFESISKYNIAKKLTIEIVEQEGIENEFVIKEFVNKLKSLGIKIAIDDFGTGYSNFDFISKLKVDYLKIDGSLIKDININSNKMAIVKTIINFANNLNMQTIAEHVENAEVYNILKSIDIDYVQGFFIAIPSEAI